MRNIQRSFEAFDDELDKLEYDDSDSNNEFDRHIELIIVHDFSVDHRLKKMQ
jgi:hypothetical protein